MIKIHQLRGLWSARNSRHLMTATLIRRRSLDQSRSCASVTPVRPSATTASRTAYPSLTCNPGARVHIARACANPAPTSDRSRAPRESNGRLSNTVRIAHLDPPVHHEVDQGLQAYVRVVAGLAPAPRFQRVSRRGRSGRWRLYRRLNDRLTDVLEYIGQLLIGHLDPTPLAATTTTHMGEHLPAYQGIQGVELVADFVQGH